MDACPACGRLREARACARHAGRGAVARCVVCRLLLCRRCDRTRRGYSRCADHAAIPMIEGWTQVYGSGDEFDAGLVRARLSAEGIPAHLFSQKDHLYVVTHGELAVVRVLVPAPYYLKAREALDEDDPGASAAARCPLCGELLPPGTRECERCGELPENGAAV